MKQHNEAGPDRKRLQSKKQLLEAKKELKVEQKKRAVSLSPPENNSFPWRIGTKASEGQLIDQSKVVTEVVFGKKC